MSYIIKKGVPIPLHANARSRGGFRTTLEMLKISEMFDTGMTRKQFPAQTVATFLKRNPTLRFVTRTMEKTKTIGIWRVEDKKP